MDQRINLTQCSKIGMRVGSWPTEVPVMPNVPARTPAELLQRPIRILRPRDAAAAYRHPRPEIARLARAGALHRVATGYYAAVPDDRVGSTWLPELEPTALGIAAADEGIESVALIGLSAARVHGAIPRALAVAVVAASRHRSTLQLTDRPATVYFVRRDVDKLDLQRHRWDLGTGWITGVEQTVLDLVARPELGGLPDEAWSAAHALLPRADRGLLTQLAAEQRRTSALRRLLEAI
ncbi:type IV toxin-antitoxin system AbiEi family antitoxin domain-containing protein [Nocardia cyriacigeorgica]|uniref:type IV toxin-antitoxin system AbiEi family antitoxin domain-containing protein n=1 Tax=Nocardia cyriacigeorgica TaxID=135487 RepID=UPI001E2F07C8|nr:type IV toxin-antitoxin system AbiEi family antitoxin domain-containing protein [Nocardia cyriacigeorgica]